MPILLMWIILIFFWTLAIYSVSIHESFTLTLKLIASWIMDGEPSNYFYFFRQFRNIGMGLVMAVITFNIPIKFFQSQRNITIIAVLVFILQIMVFVPGIGASFNGARGWISLPWVPNIQPAELFKLGYVIFLSAWLIRKRSRIEQPDFIMSFVVMNILVLFVFFLIPDLGTVVVLGLVGLLMFWYAWARAKHIAILFVWGLISAMMVWALAGMVSTRFQYIQRRFTYFLSSDVDPQNTDIWRQNQQALLAIGGWWFFGKWYGKGLQKFGYIPEAQSDFIFSAFSEEIWFIGNLMLLAMYFYLCYYFLTNLYRVKDDYTKLIWVGIVSLIIVQMFVNMWVNLKIMPNTWLTLPFISFGGTALMVNMIEIVLLYRILQSAGQRQERRLK